MKNFYHIGRLIRITISSFLLFFIFAGPTSGQLNNHMILKKGFRNKIHFLPGDSIIIMKNNFKTPSRELIQAIGEDFIVVRSEELPIKEITAVVKVRALHYKAAGYIFKFAGPGYLLTGIINGLISGARPLILPTSALIAGAIFGTGLLLPLLQTKVCYMKRGYYLRIVSYDPETPGKAIIR